MRRTGKSLHHKIMRSTRYVRPDLLTRVERSNIRRAHSRRMMPSKFIMGLFVTLCLTCVALGYIYTNILELPYNMSHNQQELEAQSQTNQSRFNNSNKGYTEVKVEAVTNQNVNQ